MNTENLKKHVWPAVALAAVVLVGYAVSLAGDFVWDDAPLIVDNRQVQDASRILDNLTASFWETGDEHDRFRNFFRPLVALSYAADHSLWGLNPAGFHLTNLLLHLGCSLLVYRIALGCFAARPIALLAGALFAAHPVHVENVAWIAGRTDLLCALLLLASFVLYRSAPSRGGQVASWVCFGAALFSKEMAATLPLLIVLDRLFHDTVAAGRVRRALRAAAPYVAVLAVYGLTRHAVLGNPGPSLLEMTPVSWLATTLFVLGRYLTLLILPVGLDAHYPYAPYEGLAAPALLGGAMVAVVLALAWRLRRSRPEAAFWSVWVFVTLLPVLWFGRFGDVIMADRFLYIPSVGAVMLAGALAATVRESLARPAGRRAGAVCATALVVLLAVAAGQRSRVWKSDYSLFSNMLETSPHSALVHSNLGLAIYHRGEYETSVRSFRTAIQLNPNFAMAHNNLAAAYERSGKLEPAIVAYNTALRLAPGLLQAQANAGNLLVRMGYADRGLPLLEELTAAHPDYVPGLHALGDALHRLDRPDEARPLLERIVSLSPGYAPAHFLLGEIHYRQQRPAQAAESMHRFLDLWEEEGEHTATARRVIAEVEFGS